MQNVPTCNKINYTNKTGELAWLRKLAEKDIRVIVDCKSRQNPALFRKMHKSQNAEVFGNSPKLRLCFKKTAPKSGTCSLSSDTLPT